jgi:hypothetical protein
MKKLKKTAYAYQLQLLAAILAQWQRPVASIKALDLVHWVICVVLYRRTAAAIEMASKVGPFLSPFVCCCPGGRWGDMEQVVAQWRCPVAFWVALDMLHGAMPSVLPRRTTMAVEMASG